MKKLRYMACIALVVTGALMFLVRGVGHGVRRSEPNDFWSSYTVPRAWSLGQAPFKAENLSAIWQENSTQPADSFTRYVIENYFVLPPAIPILAPLAAFSWRTANALWVLISAVCFVAMLWRIRPKESDPELLLIFLGLCLWSDPVRIGLAISNVTPLLIALLGFSFDASLRKKAGVSGVLLGIVGCFKPQFAIPAALFMLARNQWKTLAYAAGTVLCALAVFLFRVRIAGVSWWSEFVHRSAGFANAGGPNDWSLLNTERYNLLNLQVLVGGAIRNATVVNLLSAGIVCVLLVIWFIATRRSAQPTMLSFATVNVLFLLPVYHRTYDAAVLAFVLAWALSNQNQSRRLRLWVVGLSLVFIQPLPTFLIVATSKASVIAAASSNALLRVLLSYEVWTLLVLSIVLTVAVRNMSKVAQNEESPVPIA